MSFILDALKKAESERNRRVAPVLMDARIASPRRGWPAWAWALGAVLVVNVAVVGWLLLRGPAPESANGTPAAPPPPLVVELPPDTQVVPGSTAPRAAVAVPPLPAAAPAAPALPSTVATPPPASDNAPAIAGDPVPTIDIGTLPSAADLRASGVALPDLELNLHIYNASPAQRSVLLNGQRVREGDYLANGLKLERITPAGVVLEAAGRRFRLDAGG